MRSRLDALRILIVDDHALFRRGLRDVLEEEPDLRVVAEAADGLEALKRVRELRPGRLDLVLMDLDMPTMGGIAATRQIVVEDPALAVVMLTVAGMESDAIEAVRAGAVGFLSKSLSPTAIIRALRDFHRDGVLPMSRLLAGQLLRQFQHAAATSARAGDELLMVPTDDASEEHADESLTARQREVMKLLARGARDRDIADELVLSESTVKKHVQGILRKLNARNRTEAVARFRGGAR
jgi:two-component system nitrate/nitrite response regulator NarL